MVLSHQIVGCDSQGRNQTGQAQASEPRTKLEDVTARATMNGRVEFVMSDTTLINHTAEGTAPETSSPACGIPVAEERFEELKRLDDGAAVEAKDDELEKLTEREAAELLKQEAVVNEYVHSYWTAAAALKVIHDGKLYRATHKTFKDYCLERWGFDRAHAIRVINAARVYENLKCLQGGDIPLPATEAQVRPLTRLSPDKHEQVWREAVQKADGGSITMKLVEEIATPHYPVKAKPIADNAVVALEPAKETPADETRRLLDRLDELLRGHENEDVVEAFTRLKELLVCGEAGEVENQLAA